MKKYGLRIGNIGVEFPSIEDRQKALNAFTKGTDVAIHNRGIKFTDGEGTFSVYDRDTKEVLTICEVCNGTFLQETCTERSYPKKDSWEKKYNDRNGYICDACFSKKIKEKELFEAKQLISESEDD